MKSRELSVPADACSPDANRDGTGASARLPEWLVHLIALMIRFVLEHTLAGRSRRPVTLPAWWNYRRDLPSGSVQQLAAARRGHFGNAIAWMCRRRGIGPGHSDWPELRCAIIAFGGSVKGFRPGLPACGLQWWENPQIMPGAIGDIAATPAATALASLLSRQQVAGTPAPPANVVRSAARHVPLPCPSLSRGRPTNSWRLDSTGPPTGPPTGSPFVGRPPFCYV
jgi:hypothetical protein